MTKKMLKFRPAMLKTSLKKFAAKGKAIFIKKLSINLKKRLN